MPFANPYLPHELDTHPDGARIKATIYEAVQRCRAQAEEVLANFESDSNSYLEEMEEIEADRDDLRYALDEAESELSLLRDKYSDLEQERDDLKTELAEVKKKDR